MRKSSVYQTDIFLFVLIKVAAVYRLTLHQQRIVTLLCQLNFLRTSAQEGDGFLVNKKVTNDGLS